VTRERMYVSPADLREFATQIFERLGLPDGDAGTVAASYVLQAIAAGQIGFAFTNSSPGMAPYGGSKPVLGVNPLAVGVPAGHRSPFVLDMAMSIIARGKMRLAAMQGESIPEGLGLDREGQPTTDGMQVFGGGTVLPFGEAKGSRLAVWMRCSCPASPRIGVDKRMGRVLVGAQNPPR